jgi:response regulator RpfG family c-di-GMP phosphodiesterase
MPVNEKILFVDDDPNILQGYQRSLRKLLRIDTALGGEEGLAAIAKTGPYAVIISDMRMPGMDGVQFLSRVKDISPDSVRMMLTGNADMNTAIEAVNEGNIFRFMTKPCEPEVFIKALQAGIQQYRLIMAERELLEKTLNRSVKALVEILSMVNPVAFSRATRVHKYVKRMVSELKITSSWQYEIAAMLSQIGCVTIPPDTIEKYYAGQALTDSEREMFTAHPAVGAELLGKIPRMESVTMMIEGQMKPFGLYEQPGHPSSRSEMDLGAQMLKAAVEFDRLVSQGTPPGKAVEELLKLHKDVDPALVATLRTADFGGSGRVAKLVKIRDLASGMVIGEDIYTDKKLLLVPKGQEITHTLVERLKNFWRNGLIAEQIMVIFESHDVKMASENLVE